MKLFIVYEQFAVNDMWKYDANFGSKGVTPQEDFPPVFFGQQINQKSTRIFVSFYTDLSTVIVEQMNSFLDND